MNMVIIKPYFIKKYLSFLSQRSNTQSNVTEYSKCALLYLLNTLKHLFHNVYICLTLTVNEYKFIVLIQEGCYNDNCNILLLRDMRNSGPL